MELDEYLNPRTVSDDFHEEIEDEELREEVDDEEALENGNKGDQEAIVVEIIMCILLYSLSLANIISIAYS